jgi:hypothetical protein
MPDVKILLLRAGFRSIAFNPFYAKISGCVKAGLLLSQAMYWQENVGADRWFYKTQQDWLRETCLTRTEQESARKTLCMLGLLEEKLAGMPAKIHFRVNLVALADKLSEFQPAEKPQASLRETCILDAGNPQTGLQESRKLYKEEESTTESTHREDHGSLLRVWEYYLLKLKKQPKQYILTAKRQQQGRARFQECLKKTGESHAAEAMMKEAIDKLAASEFHRANGYTDWEQVFRSQEKFENWFARKGNGNGNGKSKSTGAVHDTHQDTSRYTEGADFVFK